MSGAALIPDSLAKLRRRNPDALPDVSDADRIGPSVGSVGKFVCIGLNYSDHAAESGMAVPKESVVFMKSNLGHHWTQ